MNLFKRFNSHLILLLLTVCLLSGNYYSQATYHYVGTNNLQNTNSSFPSNCYKSLGLEASLP